MGKHYGELTPGHSNLISVSFQNNRDFGISSSDAMRYLVVNVQPVIPLSISSLESDTRTILPIIHAESAASGGGDVGRQSGVFLFQCFGTTLLFPK